ncbi:SIR2 family protein [Mesorhizobium sp. M0998]|uniref:SIR2 family protein n=1 Tax=Mesorhizobium sp. M0998 TaxID=2957044 RepID=UPI00333DC9DB
MGTPFAPFEEEGTAFVALKALISSAHPPLAVVGSGASVNSGYPAWPELMAELRKRAGPKALIPQRQEALKGDAAWEAEVHCQALGKKSFSEFIEHRFGPPAVLAEPHQTIAAIPFRHFLTTNYDPCIELALNKMNECAPTVLWEDGNALSRFLIGLSRTGQSRSVVYLHGRYSHPRHAILTETSYVQRYIKSDDARRKLLAIFMTNPVVFIGFSMSDPDFGNLMREVTARLRTRSPCHYALMGYGSEPEREVYRDRMRGKFGVEPVFYSLAKTGQDRYANLLQLLRALAPQTNAARNLAEAIGIGGQESFSRRLERDPNDPEKGQWGGLAQASGRRLKVVRQRGGSRNQFLVFKLVVESLPGSAPLEGDVIFHLHPTFAVPVRVVSATNGTAVLDECRAYGAFTVGVAADDQRTQLELDLALQSNLPDWFRRR